MHQVIEVLAIITTLLMISAGCNWILLKKIRQLKYKMKNQETDLDIYKQAMENHRGKELVANTSVLPKEETNQADAKPHKYLYCTDVVALDHNKPCRTRFPDKEELWCHGCREYDHRQYVG